MSAAAYYIVTGVADYEDVHERFATQAEAEARATVLAEHHPPKSYTRRHAEPAVMFELGRLGARTVVDAHGKKWVTVYNVGRTELEGAPRGTLWLAVEFDQPLPSPVTLIFVEDT